MALKKMGLERIFALCAALGHPQKKIKAIHIAGTNGKGSTAHALAAVLQAAGYTTGLYTSPHFKDFRERIRINGKPISKTYVAQFVTRHENLFVTIQPSFFEMSVALAYHYFAHRQVDIAVVETGMGGRLDATNVIVPLASVITNISLDHIDYLGHTLAEIATEKAGVIKPHVPVIIGERHANTALVFEAMAKACHAPIGFASDRYAIQKVSQQNDGLTMHVTQDGTLRFQDLSVDLGGAYQLKNLPTVLHTLDVLVKNKWVVPEDALRKGLCNIKPLTGLRGRWEVMCKHPQVIVDVVHNEDGVLAIVQQLKSLAYEQLHVVWGMVKGKNVLAVLQHLPKAAQYYFCQATVPRAMKASVLAQWAAEAGLKGKVFNSVQAALQAAQQRANMNDLVFVGGSFFVVSEVV